MNHDITVTLPAWQLGELDAGGTEGRDEGGREEQVATVRWQF